MGSNSTPNINYGGQPDTNTCLISSSIKTKLACKNTNTGKEMTFMPCLPLTQKAMKEKRTLKSILSMLVSQMKTAKDTSRHFRANSFHLFPTNIVAKLKPNQPWRMIDKIMIVTKCPWNWHNGVLWRQRCILAEAPVVDIAYQSWNWEIQSVGNVLVC